MAELMRPIPFSGMLEWICGEYAKRRSIFGIPESCFFRKTRPASTGLLGEDCGTPLGPAAGPHTQLAQNIVAAYLVGGRFVELKTVQKLDSLRIDKPCIDARDEGYNTEWSTELSLEQAFDEYLKAWVLLHFLEWALGLGGTRTRTFLFNMSVGYDLEGIRTQCMQSFIDGLGDASPHALYGKYLAELEAFLEAQGSRTAFGGGGERAALRALPGEISARISSSVTLSTMHGCPPEEIEAICAYLLEEKGLHTFVKLNPTLLGFEKARSLLEAGGFGYLNLQESSFTKDLQYPDAVRMLERLAAKAAACGRRFGVKLSNTLPARNLAGILPGDEMYLSGRALFPLTVNLAALLAAQFRGTLPISFSGGVSQLNARELFEAGIRPLTIATDLLKPGGYLRMKATADLLEPLLPSFGQLQIVDSERLSRIAAQAAAKRIYQKAWRGEKKVAVAQKLPLLDCYVAPCVTACPIHQDVPEYLRLAGAGRFDEALEVIYRANPLPNITGHICDHPCMRNCTRMDYEGPVGIREVKRIAAAHGGRAYRAQARTRAAGREVRAAVVGAGPAGLAAAYFLARAGLQVSVFEKDRRPGGVVANVLPRFRIPEAAIRRDIRTIASLGVDFHFGVSGRFSIQALRSAGYRHILLAIGAETAKKLELGGDHEKRFDALSFLRAFHRQGRFEGLGSRVAVIGGGNTAVDGARAAMRVKGVREVVVLYRRTEREMPADQEELENARRDGVRFEYLLSPESFRKPGVLRCRRMRLGETDATGRRRPEPTEEFRDMPFDSVISAIGEQPDGRVLEEAGLVAGADGKRGQVEDVYLIGDAFRGPSTVVESIADARRAAASILQKQEPDHPPSEDRFAEIYARKGRLLPASDSGSGSRAERRVAAEESLRCLECSSVCDKCVDVCPNRANLHVAVAGKGQVLHLDALCNECGNCATFCPYDGRPNQDKLTLFASEADFERGRQDGFWVSGAADQRLVHLRLHGARWEGPPGTEASAAQQGETAEVLAVVDAVIRDYGYILEALR